MGVPWRSAEGPLQYFAAKRWVLCVENTPESGGSPGERMSTKTLWMEFA